MIKAITFDFWDTLVVDDSDEPKRAARGLPSKPEARLQLLIDEITGHYPQIGPGQVFQAFEYANQRFHHNWKNEHFTPTVASRLQNAYDYLKIARTPGFDEVVREIEEMEVHIPPDFVPGVQGTLAELVQHYTLGIISDTIHTPGRGLRQLLERQSLLRHFSVCIFSDEVGAAKPSPVVFERAAAELDVPLSQIAHVGDRESNDIEGPLAMGMQAVLYTGVVDRSNGRTRASAVCKDFAELPEIINKMNGWHASR